MGNSNAKENRLREGMPLRFESLRPRRLVVRKGQVDHDAHFLTAGVRWSRR